MPNWDEINAQKRLQEERAKLRVSTGTSVQWITANTPPRPTYLSDHKPSDTSPEIVIGDPLALVSNGSPAESIPKTVKKRARQLLKIRLEHADNAMNIVENWRLERQAAPKVVKAIELLAAIEAGNVDYVRENYPILVEALQKPQKRRATPSLKESDSYTEGSDSKTERESVNRDPAVEQIAATIHTITGRDRHLNPDVYKLAGELHQLDYTAQDVEVWYRRCWKTSWPGDKGDTPSLKLVRERIGQVRNLPVDQQGQAEANPYLDDPYFARHTDNPFSPVEELPAWPPPECRVPERVTSMWLAAMGQYQIQLNRATYDTWLKHADPIHFTGTSSKGGTLYVSVPHHYGKKWIDDHLLPQLNRLFDDLLNTTPDPTKKYRISEKRLFFVEIIVEGDPVPGISKARS